MELRVMNVNNPFGIPQTKITVQLPSIIQSLDNK